MTWLDALLHTIVRIIPFEKMYRTSCQGVRNVGSIPFIIEFILLFSSITIIVKASNPQTISINPTSQTVSAGVSSYHR